MSPLVLLGGGTSRRADLSEDASDGTVFGLFNLAATCHSAEGGERAWPGLVNEHSRRILAAMQTRPPIKDMTREEVLGRVYLRVMGTSTIPPESRDWFTYARPVCGDILETLAMDWPDSVTTMRDEDVAAFGLDELKRAGLENLLREPIDAVETVSVGDGADLHVVLGDSAYTASRLLVLPDLLSRVFGERSYPHGVLVAAPFRHQIVVHPIDGIGAVIAASAMARFASKGFDEGPGSVSPFLYSWQAGAFTQLSVVNPQGELEIRAEGDFADTINRLG